MLKIVSLVICAAIALVGVNLWRKAPTSDPSQHTQLTGRHEFSTDKADSMWVVVNKSRPLKPPKYVPSDLIVPDVPLRGNVTTDESKLLYVAAEALKKMVDAAGKEGLNLNLQSGYRSHELQKKLHDLYSEQQGRAEVDTYSARPGYSEHQTGLAVDVGGTSNPNCNVRQCFAGTPEAAWLNANAYKYGFIVRYPQGKQEVTGYEHEPWHLRYVGIYLATQMKTKNVLTMEEYFNLR